MNTEVEKTDRGQLRYKALTEQIIGAFYRVYNELGYGFLEAVYEQAMLIEFKEAGIRAESQRPISVSYAGQEVGRYYADLLVDDRVLVELKATKSLATKHEAQLLNYLKATRYEVGLLLNFGPKPQIRRKVFDNDRKGSLSWTGTQDK